MGVLRVAEAAGESDGVLGEGRLQHQGYIQVFRHAFQNHAEKSDG